MLKAYFKEVKKYIYLNLVEISNKKSLEYKVHRYLKFLYNSWFRMNYGIYCIDFFNSYYLSHLCIKQF